MKTSYICITCGTEYAATETPPTLCLICSEERQYVAAGGQKWTDRTGLNKGHMMCLKDEGGLIGISSTPKFGIGQRALLVPTPNGNILWDCISLITQEMVQVINGLGGLAGIAISHPHYYTSMVEWSRAFGDIPVYLHAADRDWVMRPDHSLRFWEGETLVIAPGLTLIRCGGHYEGGTVLHWEQGPDGKGALLSGDILQVVADRKFLGFMRSYPNFIPLGEASVRAIVDKLSDYQFETIYGAFWELVIPTGGRQVMIDSAARHIKWLQMGHLV